MLSCNELRQTVGARQLGVDIGKGRESEAAEMTERSCDKSHVLLKPFHQKKKKCLFAGTLSRARGRLADNRTAQSLPSVNTVDTWTVEKLYT